MQFIQKLCLLQNIVYVTIANDTYVQCNLYFTKYTRIDFVKVRAKILFGRFQLDNSPFFKYLAVIIIIIQRMLYIKCKVFNTHKF